MGFLFFLYKNLVCIKFLDFPPFSHPYGPQCFVLCIMLISFTALKLLITIATPPKCYRVLEEGLNSILVGCSSVVGSRYTIQ